MLKNCKVTNKYKITLKDILVDTRITQGDLMPSGFWRSFSLFGTTQIRLSAKEFIKLKWQK